MNHLKDECIRTNDTKDELHIVVRSKWDIDRSRKMNWSGFQNFSKSKKFLITGNMVPHHASMHHKDLLYECSTARIQRKLIEFIGDLIAVCSSFLSRRML